MIAITFALRTESSGLTAHLRAGKIDNKPVSYTHLTLPTNREV